MIKSANERIRSTKEIRSSAKENGSDVRSEKGSSNEQNASETKSIANETGNNKDPGDGNKDNKDRTPSKTPTDKLDRESFQTLLKFELKSQLKVRKLVKMRLGHAYFVENMPDDVSLTELTAINILKLIEMEYRNCRLNLDYSDLAFSDYPYEDQSTSNQQNNPYTPGLGKKQKPMNVYGNMKDSASFGDVHNPVVNEKTVNYNYPSKNSSPLGLPLLTNSKDDIARELLVDVKSVLTKGSTKLIDGADKFRESTDIVGLLKQEGNKKTKARSDNKEEQLPANLSIKGDDGSTIEINQNEKNGSKNRKTRGIDLQEFKNMDSNDPLFSPYSSNLGTDRTFFRLLRMDSTLDSGQFQQSTTTTDSSYKEDLRPTRIRIQKNSNKLTSELKHKRIRKQKSIQRLKKI